MKIFKLVIFLMVVGVSSTFAQTVQNVNQQIIQFEKNIIANNSDAQAVNLIQAFNQVSDSAMSEQKRTLRRNKINYLIENYSAYASLVRQKSQLIRSNLDPNRVVRPL